MVNTSSKKRQRENNSSSDESESESEFQVEAIMDKRMKGKKVQYLLKWKGYSDADNTWESENNLNCPELVKAYEESLKKKTNEKPKPKRATKSKKVKVDESPDNSHVDEEPSINTENGGESDKNNDSITEPSTKSRLRSTSTNGEMVEESKGMNNTTTDTTNVEDDNNNNNNSVELLNKSSPAKESLLNEQINDPPVNLRLRITPSSNSPISLTLNDSDNNNNTNEKSNDQEPAEMIHENNDEPIEKIEGVKNDQDGISFRIKLFEENQPQWVSAKIANRKYPQAVIAFWENHVEFT